MWWTWLSCVAVCCSVLQCVAVCCSVLQCVAECCSVLQCVAVCCSMWWTWHLYVPRGVIYTSTTAMCVIYPHNGHDSLICDTRVKYTGTTASSSHMCASSIYNGHDLVAHVSRIIEGFICDTLVKIYRHNCRQCKTGKLLYRTYYWAPGTGDITHSCVCQYASICETCVYIYTDVIHHRAFGEGDMYICVLCMYICVLPLIHLWDMYTYRTEYQMRQIYVCYMCIYICAIYVHMCAITHEIVKQIQPSNRCGKHFCAIYAYIYVLYMYMCVLSLIHLWDMYTNKTEYQI